METNDRALPAHPPHSSRRGAACSGELLALRLRARAPRRGACAPARRPMPPASRSTTRSPTCAPASARGSQARRSRRPPPGRHADRRLTRRTRGRGRGRADRRERARPARCPGGRREVDGGDAGDRAGDRLEAEASVVSSWPGTVKPLTARPIRTAPNSAPRNAPTMPPQKRSGMKIVKCQSAMPIIDPHEQGHQRGLPCLRLRGFLGFGARRRPRRRASRRACACRRGRRPGARPAAVGAGAAAAGRAADAPRRCSAGWRSSSIPRSRTIASNSSRDTSVGSCGAVTLRRPPRGSTGATSTGALPDRHGVGRQVAELGLRMRRSRVR